MFPAVSNRIRRGKFRRHHSPLNGAASYTLRTSSRRAVFYGGAARNDQPAQHRRESSARGYVARAPPQLSTSTLRSGYCAMTRKQFDFTDDDLVLFHPVGVIERKNVPGGLRLAERLQLLHARPHGAATGSWGLPEDGYVLNPRTSDRTRSPSPLTMGSREPCH